MPHGYARAVYSLSDDVDMASLAASIDEGCREWPAFFILDAGLIAVTEEVLAILQSKGLLLGAQPLPMLLHKVGSKKLKRLEPPQYYWFRPFEVGQIASRRVDGLGEPSPTGLFRRYQIAPGCSPTGLFRGCGGNAILCSVELIQAARAAGLKGFWFSPVDVIGADSLTWIVDYLGKNWPPEWWPEGFTPDPRNIRSVGADALVAPLGVAAPPRIENRPRQSNPDTCLISLADVKKLKLRVEDEGYDTELTAEVPLNRPLYDCDTLAVSVVIEDEDNFPKSSQITEAVQGILKLFERVLPEIEKRIRAQFELGDPAQTEALLAGLHSPSLLFTAHELASPIRWSFVVEGDPMAVHVEFERLEIVNVWAGD